ncbi:MAG TPA: ATP-dependent helicase [Anaerolineaceae bacterium]
MSDFPRLRPSQEAILAYTGGKMGIAAVPGAGKTWTLSHLAANLIKKYHLGIDQEVLIVTLVNSAVDNFSQRITEFTAKFGLLPGTGYRVRTLHGLAHDIVRERPELAGLDDTFQIIDERESNLIRQDIARHWLTTHGGEINAYLDPEIDEFQLGKLRSDKLPDLVQDIALQFIRIAKDRQLTPDALQARLETLPAPLPLAAMGCEMYAAYQRALAYRGGVDFDDLIRLALLALQRDPALLARLQERWQFILEDEAQDSSHLQEEILATLSSAQGNWVRVGDPNQAIYETFTTASPTFLREFLSRKDVQARALPESGRSARPIIELANRLIEWSQNEHPIIEVRGALSLPWILPTAPGDPQPNPPDEECNIHLSHRKFTPQEEINEVAENLKKWLPYHPESTVAVLVPRNQRGFELVDELKKRGIDFVDSLLAASKSTRLSAGTIGAILRALALPNSSPRLAEAFQAWTACIHRQENDQEETRRIEKGVHLIRSNRWVEDYLYPLTGKEWLERAGGSLDDPVLYHLLERFRSQMQRWQAATLLPVDQLVLTLSQDLFTEPAEIAVAHKLAGALRRAALTNPSWQLPELSEEMTTIARNERRFIGFDQEDTGFDPNKYRGRVVIATVHKAKGLEWDRVYLMSVNNYDFPSGMPYDTYISEKWFVRGRLNLPAEALEQLRIALSNDNYEWYQESLATQNARLDYVRERLRLLFVGITRARKELIITWNTGRDNPREVKCQPAVPLVALQNYLENRSR